MVLSPLKSIRVLDLTVMPPGGYCTVLLADLGAEVIRIDAPAQRGKPSTVLGQMGLSRGKRSITLDQRHPRANAVLLKLAASVDVVVDNAKPGAMEARGFGYAQANAVNPRIIWCGITGFGQDGPYADRAGHDLSYMAHSGLLTALSPQMPWHPAAMVSVPTGGLMAATGILAALVERSVSGKGAFVDISLADASTWLLSGQSYTLSGGRGIPMGPDRRLYACADGLYICLAAAEPRTWGALCEGLGLPELLDKLHKPDAAEAVGRKLAEVFATRAAAEWVAELGPRGAAVTAVNSGRAVIEDPHNSVHGTTIEVAGEAVPANPIRLRDAAGDRSGNAADPPHPAGDDNDDVLTSAGFSAGEIAGLREAGVI